MPLLDVKNLSVQFRSDGKLLPTVTGVSFTLERGEMLALVGESGCGKSVTCMSLARLLPEPPVVLSGEVLLDRGPALGGVADVLRLNDRSLRQVRGGCISYIFQEPSVSLNPVFRVGDQIAEAVRLHRKDVSDPFAEAVELLRQVGIPDPANRAKQYPHEMSGGMQQRVMIAMALAQNPELLIADEPTTALDVTTQRDVLDLIAAIADERKMAVLLITHNLGLVARYSHDVNVMYAGEIVERGTVPELLRAPRHPYTQGLLAAVPRLDAPKDAPLADIPGTVPPPTDWPTGCAFHPRCPKARPECRSEDFNILCEKAGDASTKCIALG